VTAAAPLEKNQNDDYVKHSNVLKGITRNHGNYNGLGFNEIKNKVFKNKYSN